MNLKSDTMGELVEKFVTLRDKLREADDRHKQRTSGARETLTALEVEMLDRLNQADGNSFASPAGTVYRTSRKSATIMDSDIFRSFVIDNKAWDLVDIRANGPATAAYLDEHGAIPPGVNYTVHYTVGVRRSDKK
jgi:hypothetical protein